MGGCADEGYLELSVSICSSVVGGVGGWGLTPIACGWVVVAVGGGWWGSTRWLNADGRVTERGVVQTTGYIMAPEYQILGDSSATEKDLFPQIFRGHRAQRQSSRRGPSTSYFCGTTPAARLNL